jgi:ligand-binding sensor domain-containing protein
VISTVFTPGGNYLLFVSNRNYNANISSVEWNYSYNDMSRIYAIALDSLNHLWVGTNEGLNYYLPERDIWKHYKYDEKNTNGLPGRVVFDLIIRSNGELWAATSGLIVS